MNRILVIFLAVLACFTALWVAVVVDLKPTLHYFELDYHAWLIVLLAARIFIACIAMFILLTVVDHAIWWHNIQGEFLDEPEPEAAAVRGIDNNVDSCCAPVCADPAEVDRRPRRSEHNIRQR
jgi:hypothetical protein